MQIRVTFVLHSTEPTNYTGSYTAEYRLIIAGILREVIKTAPIFTKSYLIELYSLCAPFGYGWYYNDDYYTNYGFINITITIPIVLVKQNN